MSAIGSKFDGEIFRKDHPIVIALNRHHATILPIRLAYDAGGYVAGQVLGQNSVDSSYADYGDSASSGLDTARCVLFESHGVEDFPSATGTIISRGIFKGTLFKDKLTGLTSAAIADFAGKTWVGADGVNLFDIP